MKIDHLTQMENNRGRYETPSTVTSSCAQNTAKYSSQNIPIVEIPKMLDVKCFCRTPSKNPETEFYAIHISLQS